MFLKQGELAFAFGDLLRKLWAIDRTPVAPRQFKAKLGRFAPQFSGFNQHDSQVSLLFYFRKHTDILTLKHTLPNYFFIEVMHIWL